MRLGLAAVRHLRPNLPVAAVSSFWKQKRGMKLLTHNMMQSHVKGMHNHRGGLWVLSLARVRPRQSRVTLLVDSSFQQNS